jgi:NADH dehydrogenase FAD-containing subunit
MSQKPVVIVGGGYGGLMAAVRLAWKQPTLPIVLVDPGESMLERVRLHLASARSSVVTQPRMRLLPKSVRHLACFVEQVKPDEHRLQLSDGSSLEYAHLILATGSRPVLPEWADERFLGVHHRAQLDSFRQTLRAETKVVVVGGGLTGLEVTSELAVYHPTLQLTLLAPSLGADWLHPRTQEYASDWMHRHDVTLKLGVTVTGVRGDSLMLSDGGETKFDAVVWAGGFQAVLPQGLERFERDTRGRLFVNEHLLLADCPNISVIGDAAHVALDKDRVAHMSCQAAMPMGAYVAERLDAESRKQPLEPFRFVAPGVTVSLGPSDGFLQFLNARQQPEPRFLKGRKVSWIKGFLLWWTTASLRWERRLQRNVYLWDRGKPQTLKASTTHPTAEKALP